MKNVIFFIYLEMQEFILLYPRAIAKYEFDNISNTYTIEIPTLLYNNDKVINWIHTFYERCFEYFPSKDISIIPSNAKI